MSDVQPIKRTLVLLIWSSGRKESLEVDYPLVPWLIVPDSDLVPRRFNLHWHKAGMYSPPRPVYIDDRGRAPYRWDV